MNNAETYEILKTIKFLKELHSHGTELITVYVPAEKSINSTISKLRNEAATSGNIKSKQVRTNVVDSINRIIAFLQQYNKTPPNGLAIFSGNNELFYVEPENKINQSIYHCDSYFDLEPLESAVVKNNSYVLLVLDGNEATIAVLSGTNTRIVKSFDSGVISKSGKGGQSQNRFARGRQESINEYYNKVGNMLNMEFEKLKFEPKGLIIGGPGPTKDNFLTSKKLNYQIKVLGKYDIGYTNESGIQELIAACSDLLKNEAVAFETSLINKFKSGLKRYSVFGYENVLSSLNSNSLKLIIISYDLIGEEKIDFLVKTASALSVEIKFISSETPLGKEFLMGFGGIGAFRRD